MGRTTKAIVPGGAALGGVAAYFLTGRHGRAGNRA